jgi:hypothetical protein
MNFSSWSIILVFQVTSGIISIFSYWRELILSLSWFSHLLFGWYFIKLRLSVRIFTLYFLSIIRFVVLRHYLLVGFLKYLETSFLTSGGKFLGYLKHFFCKNIFTETCSKKVFSWNDIAVIMSINNLDSNWQFVLAKEQLFHLHYGNKSNY